MGDGDGARFLQMHWTSSGLSSLGQEDGEGEEHKGRSMLKSHSISIYIVEIRSVLKSQGRKFILYFFLAIELEALIKYKT